MCRRLSRFNQVIVYNGLAKVSCCKYSLHYQNTNDMSKQNETSENHEQGDSSLGVVVCCARCGEKLSDEMLQEQRDEIEMELDALCKRHWEDDRLYMSYLVMY